MEIAIVKGIIWHVLCFVFGYLAGRLVRTFIKEDDDSDEDEGD